MATEGGELVESEVEFEQVLGERFRLVIFFAVILQQNETHLLQVTTDVITKLQPT